MTNSALSPVKPVNYNWMYIIRQSRRNTWSLELMVEQTDFEPVYFGEYSEEKGWSYVTVPARFASHLRHRLTGKLYSARANQLRWVWSYHCKIQRLLETH